MNPDTFLASYDKLMIEMQEYHSLFYQLGIVGEPRITEEFPTAAIRFNGEGRFLEFIFNPKFIKNLSWEEVKLICCHEMLHILLKHGVRGKDNKLNHAIANIAMDVVVNESLFNSFGFLKSDCPNLLEKNGLGIQLLSTTFKGIDNIQEKQSFEYYYNKLVENCETVDVVGLCSGPNGGTLDSHNSIPGLTEQELKELLQEATGDEELADQIAEGLKKNNEAGTALGKETLNTICVKKRKKKSWETVVSSIRKTRLGMIEEPGYQWVKPSRRLFTSRSQFLLPSIKIAEPEIALAKWDIYLYQDVSGSCIDYCQRFINAARSIPTDVFNIKFFTFDTTIRKVDLKDGKFQGGGGTSFSIIEDHIQSEKVKNKSYPKLVFVITDGYGNRVNPEKPKNWFWFLTEQSCASLIPKESKTFQLR